MLMRIVVTLSALLLLGCGDGVPDGSAGPDDAPANPTAPDQPAAPPSADSARPSNDAPAPSPEDTSDNTPDHPPDDPSDDPSATADAVDPQTLKREVESLVRQTRFREALRRCRQAKATMPPGPDRRWVSEKIVELTDAARKATGLSFAMERLHPDQPVEARNAARRRLRRAGEVGRVFLRKAVRDRQPAPIATAAARLLREWGDARAANLFTRQLADPLPDPLRAALVRGAVANVQALDLESLLRLTRFAGQPAASRHRAELNEALQQAARRRDFEPQTLDALHHRTLNDPAFEHRHVARFLAMIYAEGATRQDKRFNAMFSVDDPLTHFRDYADRAASADDESLARWGETTRDLLRPFDFATLRKGLLAWWGFDDRGKERIADLSPGGHDAKTIGEPVGRTEGVIGAAVQLPGDDRGVESRPADGEPFERIQEHNFSFVAWARPDGLPTGNQPDAYWGVVVKEGWHIGLMLGPKGRFRSIHYLNQNQAANATSPLQARPGQWYHLIHSVDVKRGRVTLYVNGERVDQADFSANADPWNRYRNKPVRVGLARFARRNWAYRFRGAIDEVAVYRRALTAEDAAALYRIRSAGLRAKLLEWPNE